MALKDLLLHVEATSSGEARADYAIALAKADNAHLVALAFAPSGVIPHYGAAEVMIPLPEDFLSSIKARAEAALAKVRTKAEAEGVSVETRLIRGLPIDQGRQMAVHVRHVDCAVLGQPEPDEETGHLGLIEDCLFGTGRPAVITPRQSGSVIRPQRLMAAWDGSPEATRAFNDALPFMREAGEVAVVVVNPENRPADHGADPGADIALHLARHGVKAKVVQVHERGMPIGEVLLGRAREMGSDMIVMGAYHHSRLREFVIGGATRYVLDHTHVPVFMAH